MESERVRGHIATMAKRLTRALAMIDPAPAAEKEARRARLVALALDSAEKENHRMLSRKVGAQPCAASGLVVACPFFVPSCSLRWLLSLPVLPTAAAASTVFRAQTLPAG